MADLFGTISYPGVDDIFIDATYVCSQGITPGQVTVSIGIPASGIPTIAENADLTISDGSQSLVIRDCKVANLAAQAGGGGQTATLTIEDRRWRWRGGQISGRYNVIAEQQHTVPLIPLPGQPIGNQPPPPPPDQKGEEPIRPETKKKAPDLAKLCLKAMGETHYDIAALDTEATPTVEWDVANPAQALQQLVEDLGCRVIYQPDSDMVLIAKQGTGADLPGGVVLATAPSLKPKPRPKNVRMYGARKKWQMRFALEAVGMDFDGGWRPIDKLSYKPTIAGGWQATSPPGFGNIEAGSRTKPDAVALAKQWVYRVYRIRETGADGEGKLLIPPDGKGKEFEKKIRQVRLLPNKVQVTRDDLKRKTIAPAACYGRHSPKLSNLTPLARAWADTDSTTEVKVPFTIDAEHQIIVFAEYVYSVKDDGRFYPAEIVLECACEVTDNDTHQFVRWYREQRVPDGIAEQPHVFVREDVQWEAVATYDDELGDLESVDDNEPLIRPRADYYLNAEVLRFATDEAGDDHYPGIRPDIQPDGAIQQVTYSVGGGRLDNPSTRASRNTEHVTYLPTYRQRRVNEEVNFDQLRRERVDKQIDDYLGTYIG